MKTGASIEALREKVARLKEKQRRTRTLLHNPTEELLEPQEHPGLSVWVTTDGDGIYEIWGSGLKPRRGKRARPWQQYSRKGNCLCPLAELVTEKDLLAMVGGDRSLLPTEDKPKRLRMVLRCP